MMFVTEERGLINNNIGMKAIDWINHLNMSRHPEGGYYKEIFRPKN